MTNKSNRPVVSKEEDDKAHLGASSVIHWRLGEWFKELSGVELERMRLYHEELLKFNKTVNMIGVKTIGHADVIHFADSILAARQILKVTGKSEIYDIGSGNGFPGLVMAILSQTTQVTLVDVDPRKCKFFEQLVTHLKLKNVKILNTQAEKIPAGSIQFAVCRGFASISKTILVLRKPVAKGGSVFHLKSEEWFKEVSEIPTQLCSFWKPSLFGEYRLPVGEVTFSIVRTDKTSVE